MIASTKQPEKRKPLRRESTLCGRTYTDPAMGMPLVRTGQGDYERGYKCHARITRRDWLFMLSIVAGVMGFIVLLTHA